MNLATIRSIVARLVVAVLLILPHAVLGPAQTAQAAPSHLWIGMNNGNWLSSSNWNPAGPPQNGDSLGFQSGLSNNDINGLSLLGIGIGGNASLIGNPLTITSQIACDDFLAPLPGSISCLIGMNLALPAGTITVNVGANDVLYLDGLISGLGAINKTGPGRLVLSATNTFSGGLTITAGKVVLNANAAAGSGAVTVGSGATLSTGAGAAYVGNSITLAGNGQNDGGALRSEGGTHTFSGTLTLANTPGATVTLTNLGGEITLSGQIVGGSATTGLVLNGGGDFRLGGSQPNTYAANLALHAGTLTLDKTNGQAVTTSLQIGSGTGTDPATVKTLHDHQLSATTPVTLKSYSKLDLNGTHQFTGSLKDMSDKPCELLLSGTSGAGELTINSDAPGYAYFYCELTGLPASRIVVNGGGLQDFGYNTSPFSGTIEVQGTAATYLDISSAAARSSCTPAPAAGCPRNQHWQLGRRGQLGFEPIG